VQLLVLDRRMSPRLAWRRAPLYQPMYSTTASSSCVRDRQTRSAISSVLKLSTNDSASALSYASPTQLRGERSTISPTVLRIKFAACETLYDKGDRPS